MYSHRTRHYAVHQTAHASRGSITSRVAALFATVLLLVSMLFSGVQTAAAQSGATLGNDSTDKNSRRPTAQQIADRRRMEALFEQRIETMLFDKLQTTDEQRVKMRVLKKRLDVDKNQLFKDEIDFRRAMRSELTGSAPNDAQLTQLLEKWPGLQRRRIEIEEREQKELARFLLPIQRARYFAFMDEFRRSKQDTQWGRGDRDRGGPGMPGMPGMRGDSTGSRGGAGGFRGGAPGGRGSHPPQRDSIKK